MLEQIKNHIIASKCYSADTANYLEAMDTRIGNILCQQSILKEALYDTRIRYAKSLHRLVQISAPDCVVVGINTDTKVLIACGDCANVMETIDKRGRRGELWQGFNRNLVTYTKRLNEQGLKIVLFKLPTN